MKKQIKLLERTLGRILNVSVLGMLLPLIGSGAPDGGVIASSVEIDGRSFSFDGSFPIVKHVDGPVAIVSSTSVVVTPPATETLTGGIGSGTMLNPVHVGGQAFDERRPDWNGDLLVEDATSMSPGDIMVSSISRPNNEGRSGTTLSYQMIYVTATEPSPESLAPAAIAWTGRSGVENEGAVDWDAKLETIEARTITATVRQNYGAIMAGLGFNPGYAHYNARATPGYEWSTPWRWGGPQSGGGTGTLFQPVNNANWGGYLVKRLNESLAALHDDAYTSDERKQILVQLASFGKQTWTTLSGQGKGISPDGGHGQFENICIQIYLWVTGQTEALDTLFSQYGSNYEQAFTVDASYEGNLAPFGDPDVLNDYAAYPYHPWMYHWRRIASVSGDQVTINTSRAYANIGPYTSNVGDEQKGRFKGLILTDGTDEYLITGTNSDLGNGASTTSFEVAGHRFSAGDAVYMKSDYTVGLGESVWGIRGLDRPQSVVLTTSTSYSKDPRWTTAFLTMFAMGQMRPDYEGPVNYMIQSNRSAYPTATQDLQYMNDAGTNAEALWLEHGSSILEMVQPYMLSGIIPSAAIELTKAVAPGTLTPGSLQDGIVIGVVPGATTRTVELHGTGTSGTTPQIRIRRQNEGTTVVDWVSLSEVSWNGSEWTGLVSLPKGDDWWTTDVRYLEDPEDLLGYGTSNTTKWSVGYKIMVIGQSQLPRWLGHVWTADSTPFSAEMDGLVSFYAYGAAGTISLYANGGNQGDGIAQTANIIGDGDPTPVMFFSQYYPGTGIDEFLDDSDSTRSWNDLQARVDMYGNDFTATVSLYGSDSIRMDNRFPKPPYVYDRDVYACVDWTTGDLQHETSEGQVDHYFNDVCQTGAVHTFACIPRYAVNTNDSYANELLIDELNARGLAYGCPSADMTMEVSGALLNNQHSEEQGPGSRAMGRSIGMAVRRGMGLATPENPYFAGTGVRSVDGSYIEVDVVLPSGGSLYSRAPNALSSFAVSENGGSSFSGAGFVATISGSKVRLTKTTGTWATAASLRVQKYGNLGNHDGKATSAVLDDAMIDGELYEAVGGVYRDGIPIHGILNDGKWTFPKNTLIDNIVAETTPDTEAPSAPANLSLIEVTTSTIEISWSASSDNVGVSEYMIYIEGMNPTVVTEPGVILSGLTPGMTYVITVGAKDAAGNESGESAELEVTTGTTTNLDVFVSEGIGWLNTKNQPWMWSYTMNGWLYISDVNTIENPFGFWSYVRR